MSRSVKNNDKIHFRQNIKRKCRLQSIKNIWSHFYKNEYIYSQQVTKKQNLKNSIGFIYF